MSDLRNDPDMKQKEISPESMSQPSCVGVNIGAISVKVVALRGNELSSHTVTHQGRPLEILGNILTQPEFRDAAYFGVSGRRGHISEVAAVQRALREIHGDFDAVTSLGGESFLVYILSDGKISNVLSHNKCAAGSGEFFMQQIGRMGLGVEEAIQCSQSGAVVPLACRCSVHCKSDITHKLNRKESSPADILHTLHDSMADKVVSLLEKGQCPLRRVLIIGGVSRNPAMLAALREKRPSTEFVVSPESHYFEAWGCALITRDDPRYTSLKISPQPSLASFPSLRCSADRVQIIASPPRRALPDGPLVLGIDAGSTTTKAILLDPISRAVVASHYTRTRSEPVAATRECLRHLAGEVGNRGIGLIAATGSARELVGAYTGTAHVYNEISAHARGAAHFDPEVDTIFEIGGQDSKYIYLRNGVPIDYAMNNACSAGTGSFLEESAQGDLGIAVNDIAEIALNAPSPAQLKATCAAFINSDIRIAFQQGQTQENIVAGLVYAIAANYLTKVKGQRPVGRKVFLQGGVALNRAIGHAFAQSVDRTVVIPPNPELMGALGVALLAVERSDGIFTAATDLLALAAPELESPGRFTCGACRMRCSIDRFEVAGRKFPFGGRCSLFESVWKRKTQTSAAHDLVDQRARLIFGMHPTRPNGSANNSDDPLAPERGSEHDQVKQRIGIPRALTTHSLYPLYSTFLSRLGREVVLSGVDPRGDLKSYSGFCFPAQTAHGAILDLVRQGVNLVFMPHVVRMPQPTVCHDSFLCPITQASPYFLAKAFSEVRFLSPLLDFTHNYEIGAGLVEMAMQEFGTSRERVLQAWEEAESAQTKAERAMQDLGQQALGVAIAQKKPAILLAGHSYNAYAPEASQSVGKKLSSMGVTTIPADCLATIEEGPTAWYFPNQVMNAVALAKQHPNLFIILVSNYSCTVDAFTHAMIANEMGPKPYLIIELDAHTADAGVQTRLEAFLDIIGNYQRVPSIHTQQFSPCRLDAGRVIRSNGESVALNDPRVNLYFPNFSEFHSGALAMAVRWVGLHAGNAFPLDRGQLEQGLQYTSGRECLPLPLCIGQLLRIHEQRQPDEIVGFFMLEGGAPCVVDSYLGYLERFIVEQQLADIFVFSPQEKNDGLGFDKMTLARHTALTLLVADILVEIENVLRVVGPEGSVDQLRRQWERFVATTSSPARFQTDLPGFVGQLAALPRTREPQTCPRVLVLGDFFTRFSPFFMEGVLDLYTKQGVILKPVDLTDLVLYHVYHAVAETAHGWDLKPGGLALAKACTRILQSDGKHYLQHWLAYQLERWYEGDYRKLFGKTGLLVAGSNDAASLFEKASAHVSPEIYGEIIPTIGRGLEAETDGYDGIIIIGPFNCLPFRISESILRPLCIQRGMPMLTYETDGYAVSPSVLRQVDVNIQQILEHAACTRQA